jgi:hypothetical protein
MFGILRRDRMEAGRRQRRELRQRAWQLAGSWLWTAARIFAAIVLAQSLSVVVAHFWSHEILTTLDLKTILALVTGGAASSILVTAPIRGFADVHAERWRRIARKLDEQAHPENFYSHRVFLQTDRNKDKFLGQIDNLPGDGEILLLLKQAPKQKVDQKDPPYRLGNMQDQIENLFDKRPDEAKRFHWVCFVTQDGECIAYQDFNSFNLALRSAKKQEYEHILNIDDRKTFVGRLRSHRGDNVVNTAGFGWADSLPELEHDRIVEPLTNKEALVVLSAPGRREHLMLVDHKARPIGVVTLRELVNDVVLNDGTIAGDEQGIVNRALVPGADEEKSLTESASA